MTLKTLITIIDADLPLCYDDVMATVLSIIKHNGRVTLKFDILIEELETSAHMFFPQFTPLLVKVNSQISTKDCVDACHRKGQKSRNGLWKA